MSFWTITLISLAAGLVLIIGGALVVYMGSLVKSAYALRVEMRGDIDDRLRKVDEDMDKKSKWIKRDLMEEIEKIRLNLNQDSAKRHEEAVNFLTKKLNDFEEMLRLDRKQTTEVLDNHKGHILALDRTVKNFRRELNEATTPEAAKDEDAAPGDALDKALAAKAGEGAEAPAEATAKPAEGDTAPATEAAAPAAASPPARPPAATQPPPQPAPAAPKVSKTPADPRALSGANLQNFA